MDPNACLARIARLLDESRTDRDAGEELDYAVQDLYDWIAKGGFAPTWEAFPLASSYYDTRAVTHRKGGRVELGA